MPPRKKNSGEGKDTVEGLLSKYDGLLFRGNSEELVYGRIPFNITALDSLIGGGIPKKRITMLVGQSNAGKSYLASQAVVSVQKSGGKAFWIDNEVSWDEAWMRKCGVDTENIYIARPHTGEEGFNMMRDMMQTNAIDLVVLDSLSGVVPSSVMEQDDFNYNPMNWQARFINQSLPKMLPELKHDTAILLINQLRTTIGATPALSDIPGGKGQTFYSHLILKVRRDGWINEGNNRVGFDIEIRNIKTKSGGQSERACIIPFRFGGGIDVVESEIREAIAHDFIKRSGAWYQLPSGEKVMGMGGLTEYYKNNPIELEGLVRKVGIKEGLIEVEEEYNDWVLTDSKQIMLEEEDNDSTAI